MAGLSQGARRQVSALLRYYRENSRPEAARNLLEVVQLGSDRIDREPEAGLAAPRPYPYVARDGRRWIKQGRYWIAYSLTNPPVILAVIFESADLPRRL